MDLLAGWYPGLGEVEKIRRMSPVVQDFIRDACEEDPDFLEGYLLGVLDQPDSEDILLADLCDAITAMQFAEAGLGEYEVYLGNLGKSFLKKVGKAIKKVAKAPLKVAKVIKQKVERPIVKGVERATHAAGRIGKKYGNTIITAAGIVLSPFTGGASLAVAAALTAANTAYQKKAAARKAKNQAKGNAAQLTQEAQQQQNAAAGQMDQFYAQNQQWFTDNLGLTPDKWNALSFDQKVNILQNGMKGQQPAPGATQPQQQPTYDAGGAPASGGGGGMTMPGGGGGGGDPYGGGAQQPGRPQVATSSMFDSSMLPFLGAGVALALVFGKSAPGSKRRTKRNPGRRRRRVA